MESDIRFLPYYKGLALESMRAPYINTGFPTPDNPKVSVVKNILISGRHLGAAGEIKLSPDNNGDLVVWKSDAKMVKEGGTVLYAGLFEHHWGHFIAFVLQRLWWIARNPESIPDKILFHVATPKDLRSPAGNVKRVLELLGILDKTDLVYDPGFNPLPYPEVIIPDVAVNPDKKLFSPLYRELIEFIVSKVPPKDSSVRPRRKIFLTRSRLRDEKGKDIAIKQFDDMFRHNGFEVIAPEELSFDDMVNMFREAEMVVSPSGTTAHNLFFVPNNCECVVLERQANNNPIQVALELAMGKTPLKVEASYSFKSVAFGSGPFLYGFTKQMRDWMKMNDLEMTEGASHYPSKKDLRRYIQRHRRLFRWSDYSAHYIIEDAPALAESTMIANELFGEWIDGSRPLFWYDYFSPRIVWRIIKRCIKRTLRLDS